MIEPMIEIVHNEAKHRFEYALPDADPDNETIAAAYYKIDENGHRALTHTEVPEEFAGQGIASALARTVFDNARVDGIKLILKCPFMAAWYARHPDYADVVAG